MSSQVQLSRFFSWPCQWKRFAPFYTFLGKVHAFRRAQAGVGQEEGDEGAADGEVAPVGQLAAEASRSNRQIVPEEILHRLKELQSKKPTLEVVHDILQDQRVKVYANMPLGCSR